MFLIRATRCSGDSALFGAYCVRLRLQLRMSPEQIRSSFGVGKHADQAERSGCSVNVTEKDSRPGNRILLKRIRRADSRQRKEINVLPIQRGARGRYGGSSRREPAPSAARWPNPLDQSFRQVYFLTLDRRLHENVQQAYTNGPRRVHDELWR